MPRDDRGMGVQHPGTGSASAYHQPPKLREEAGVDLVRRVGCSLKYMDFEQARVEGKNSDGTELTNTVWEMIRYVG